MRDNSPRPHHLNLAVGRRRRPHGRLLPQPAGADPRRAAARRGLLRRRDCDVAGPMGLPVPLHPRWPRLRRASPAAGRPLRLRTPRLSHGRHRSVRAPRRRGHPLQRHRRVGIQELASALLRRPRSPVDRLPPGARWGGRHGGHTGPLRLVAEYPAAVTMKDGVGRKILAKGDQYLRSSVLWDSDHGQAHGAQPHACGLRARALQQNPQQSRGAGSRLGGEGSRNPGGVDYSSVRVNPDNLGRRHSALEYRSPANHERSRMGISVSVSSRQAAET